LPEKENKKDKKIKGTVTIINFPQQHHTNNHQRQHPEYKIVPKNDVFKNRTVHKRRYRRVSQSYCSAQPMKVES
jgi:hypothetical protein